MNLTRHLYLIGYRGSGKTMIGRNLASQLSVPHVDSDVQIEKNSNRTIAEIFASEGEAYFRDLEEQAIAEIVTRETPHIVSLGGGAILRESNRGTIANSGFVVWLQADAQTLASRIADDPASSATRPNLTARGGLAEVEAILKERTPLYDQCANVAINTAGKLPEEIVAEIIAS